MKENYTWSIPFLTLSAILLCLPLCAQKGDRLVSRCIFTDYEPVSNIFVDAENIKWVATPKKILQVKASNYADPLELGVGIQSVYGFRGGNADVRWSVDAITALLKTELDISATHYDAKNDLLWIGTSGSGLFALKTQPQLTVFEKLSTANSKLKSNDITDIFVDKSGKYWICTPSGLLSGTPGKWKGELDFYNVKRVRESGGSIYVLADEGILTPRGAKWETYAINEKALEGEVIDFDIDPDGKFWILSSFVAEYDLLDETAKTYSGPEYYTSEFGKCIAADPDGTIWVGTVDKGLYVFEKSSNLTVNAVVEKELTCTGNGQDANLKVKIVGGKAPYTYQWSVPSMQGDSPKNIAAGTYSVTVTEAGGKTKAAKITVDDPRPKVTAQQRTQESGPGKADGIAEVKIPEGAAYTYKWSNGATSAVANKLVEGAYNVTVTSQKGCNTIATVNISQKSTNLMASIEPGAAISCAGGTTTLKAVASGGKAPYQYKWNNPALEGDQVTGVTAGKYTVTITDAIGTAFSIGYEVKQPETITATIQVTASSSPGKSDGKATTQVKGGAGKYSYKWDNQELTPTAVKLAIGQHTLTVTDANGCSTTATVNISENLLPLAAQIEELSPIKCAGGNGSLKVKVSGGKSPYQYLWNIGALVGESPENVPSGNYQVTVTDAVGTKITVSTFVKQPEPIMATVQVQKPASTGNADGKALVQAKGGIGNYTYNWDSGEVIANAIKLSPGKHLVTITDANGCSTQAQANISENILPLTASIQEIGNITCNGGQVSLKVEVTGGKSPYQFQWNSSNLKGDQLTSVTAGDYQLTVTDAVGGKFATSIKIKQPDALTATILAQNPASTGNADGKATLQIKGGTGPFIYVWDTGETGITSTKLNPGKHSVTITDANRCTTQATIEIFENILPLAGVIQEIGKIKCSGGQTSLQASVSGGKGPYQYQWSNAQLKGDQPSGVLAGDYQLTITDVVNNKFTATISVKQPDPITAVVLAQSPASTGKSDGKANAQAKGGSGVYTYAWDNGETSVSASKLAPGKHTVTVTDANGCIGNGVVEITENILPLSGVIQETSKIKCASGDASLSVSVSGGKGPFQYQWSNPALQGDQPTAVKAGDYQLTITDVVNNKITANISVKQPEIIAVTVLAQVPASTGKSDGKASAQAKGGTGAYVYSWDNGENSIAASKLAPGKHTLTVTDANGCTGIGTVEVTENILPLAATLQEAGKIRCAGGEGILQVNVSGGKGPFQYQWSNPALKGEAPNQVKAGEYQVTVTDAVNNKTIASITLKQPDAITVNVLAQSPASTGKSDGKALAQAQGGTGTYSYTWDNGETIPTASKLAPNKHVVTVTDANGCTGNGSIEITENILPLSAVIQEMGKIKCADGESSLKVTISGGKAPFKYEWSNPALQGDQPIAVKAGDYQLNITDAVGNKFTASTIVKQPDAIVVTVSIQSPASTGNSDGKATAQAKGGSGSYTYAWDNSETGITALKLAPTKHTLTVTDANGCKGTATLEINENILPLAATVQETGKIKCAGGESSLKVAVTGGKGPFQYEWSNAALQGDQPSNVKAGDYQLTITDVVKNTFTAKITVKQPEALTVDVQGNLGATTERSKDGRATLKVKGGAAPYTFTWDNAESAALAKQLTLGAHSATVTDANGCTATVNVKTEKRILPALTASTLSNGQTIGVEQLQFDADSTKMNDKSLPVLNEMYNFLQENGGIVIEVGGHTNNIPPDAFCDRLSTARAKSVADYLIAKGIDPNRVFFKGYGKRKPIASNDTAEGRKQNQRVEIKILQIR